MKQIWKKSSAALLSLLTALLLTLPAFASGSSGSAVSDAASGVVQVYTETTLSNGTVIRATGSAFGVGTVGEETNTFVTNRHVVSAENADGSYTIAQRVYIMLGEGSITMTYRTVQIGDTLYDADALAEIGLDAGDLLDTQYDANYNRMVECTVLDYSDDYDCAIIQTAEPVSGRIALELAEGAEAANVADTVYAMGYPAVSDATTTATGWVDSGNSYAAYIGGETYELPIWTYTQTYNSTVGDVTVTTGSISRFTTMTSENAVEIIQHDASINSGNSGGPLVDANGVVVGINTYSGTAAENLNYAIYIDYAVELMEDNGVEYNLGLDAGLPVGAIIAIVVAAVAIVAAVVLLALRSRRRKNDAGQTPAPGPAPTPERPNVQPAAAVTDSGLRIQGESGYFAGRRFAINGTVHIGRDPSLCQIAYSADTKGISRVHCELTCVNGTLYLKDLGSSYGTYLVNGQRLAANQPIRLQPGDRFCLGSEGERFIVTRKGGV